MLAAADRVLVARSARLRPTRIDEAMLRLSGAANHSVLWMSMAAGFALAGGRLRRGAVRGVLSVAGASAVANGVLKPVFPRRRPPEHAVPARRRLIDPPVSSSFPSGHAASAAAFATGVALESPAAGLFVAPIAAAVAYSRVHIGVHWPSDVVVGAGVGAAIALSTRRWWAVRDDDPATLGHAVEVPALADGAGLTVFVNPRSGEPAGDGSGEIRRLLPAARFVVFDRMRRFGDQLDEAIAAHQPKALGACGGDGTVAAVASAAVRHDLPLAVFPGGTLNHFARDAGVSELQATAAALEAGRAETVDTVTVTVDGRRTLRFLNTASLGGYPDMVRIRERLEHKLRKWPAAAVATVRVLQRATPLEVDVDGAKAAVWMLFVGNGRYRPSDQVPLWRASIHGGMLDVRFLRADARASRTRLVTAAFNGTLADSGVYVRRTPSTLTVEVNGQPVSLATDGEVSGRGRRFEFRSAPASLRMYTS